jgi:hypothetical protein
MTGALGTNGNVTITNSNLTLARSADSTNPLKFTMATGSGGTSDLTTHSTTQIFFPDVNASTLSVSGSPVYSNSAGRLAKTGSTQRIKQDIENANLDYSKLYDLTLRQFKYKEDVANLGNNAPTALGFIAEELISYGLSEFVGFDAEGQPETVHYHLLPLAFIELIKQQKQALDNLTARVHAIEGSTT